MRWHRHIHLPEGEPMHWSLAGTLEFPVGTVIAKTFAYPIDARDPSLGERWLETRLEIHEPDGWTGFSYVWDEGRTDAVLAVGGASIETSWIDDGGAAMSSTYEVPNVNQCLTCHAQDGAYEPLGPTAANLNRAGRDRASIANQLDAWIADGHLEGAPPSSVRVAGLERRDHRRSRCPGPGVAGCQLLLLPQPVGYRSNLRSRPPGRAAESREVRRLEEPRRERARVGRSAPRHRAR